MATPIPGEPRASLLRDHPEGWVDHLLHSFPTEYAERFEAEAMGRHLGMIRALSPDHPVLVAAERLDDGAWRVEIVGFDAFQMLSTVCSLLAVHRLAILEAAIFTSDAPPDPAVAPRVRPTALGRPGAGRWPSHRPIRPSASADSDTPDRRRKIVDVFKVRPVGGASPDWDGFTEELTALAQLLRQGQHDEVQHRLIGRFAAALGDVCAPDATLESIQLEITAERDDRPTRVHVRTRDSFGFLCLTAGALALSGLRIVRADVRTVGAEGLVDDTLWITDRSGRPLTDPDRLLALKYALILIEHFSTMLPRATDPESALVHFSRFANDLMARPGRAREFESFDRPEVLDALVRVLGESRFLWEDFLLVQPENILPLIDDPSRWRHRRSREELADGLADRLGAADDVEGRVRAIRRFKDREIFRADLRTILGLSDGPEGFAAELSDVAEVLLIGALEVAAERLGPGEHPVGNDGGPVPVALCALGKLGGRELGFASDLELMVIWDDGRTDAPASEYFDRLVASIRQVLGVRRGATFEPDLRLRPYGKAGPPATSRSLFESYYRPDGPAWSFERQALIRLRAVAGDLDLGRAIERFRDGYVFGPEAFDLDGMRKMRELQIKQLVAPGAINPKFSPGALVDVEYAVQALQISHGRDDPSIRTPNTLAAIDALTRADRIDAPTASTLSRGCRFFRSLIGALRVVRGNAEDLAVPGLESERFAQLARRMRLGSTEILRAEIADHLRDDRRVVEQILLGLEVGTVNAESTEPS